MSAVRGELTPPLSESTLERFREAAASGRPTPAGVAIASVCASFAFGLLAKALAVSARKDARASNPARIQPLTTTAQAESRRMLQLADADVSAFKAFLAASRLPQSTDPERIERRQELDSALRRTIDVPLAGARSAAAGLELCAEAASMMHPVVLADLAAAVTLLSGALRVFLLCAEANVTQLAKGAPSYRALLRQESDRHGRALAQAEEVLQRVTATLAGGDPGCQPQGRP
jgi:formiminotetrahydrofolate cyclodeaminase